MNCDDAILNRGERTGLMLRSLYRAYGYAQYKMSKFEEYDLYAGNKDFLISDSVLTFMDRSGKLMALKPDVTLSIVRNTRDGVPGVQKVYYVENVYRVAKGSQSFREILQAGLECIGEIDTYHVAEVLSLAAESLLRISADCVLNVSHLDILRKMIDALGVSEVCRQKIMKCIGAKNLHELAQLCEEAGAPAEAAAALERLLQTRGRADEVLPRLTALGCDGVAVAQLRAVSEILADIGLGSLLHFDFSVVNDMAYYNGIVFKGFVDGVPAGVLSGGQYDRMMEKMGRSSGAIGFAVYLDSLERMEDALPRFDADMVLLYDADTEPGLLSSVMKRLTGEGKNVCACRSVPDKLKFRYLARLKGSEVEILEDRA